MDIFVMRGYVEVSIVLYIKGGSSGSMFTGKQTWRMVSVLINHPDTHSQKWRLLFRYRNGGSTWGMWNMSITIRTALLLFLKSL